MGLYSSLFRTVRDQLGDVIAYDRVPYIPIRLDPTYVAKCALASSLDKKLIPENPAVLDDVTFKKFFECNDHCSTVTLDRELCAEMRALAEADFPDILTWTDLLMRLDAEVIGPGASVGSAGQNSIFEKFFVNKHTATMHSMYNTYLSFIEALQHPARQDAEARRVELSGTYKLVAGSVLSTVPKDRKTNRTICTEPSLNMLFQQALGSLFDTVLHNRFGYDSRYQPDRNRELARIGSLDDQLATIDLSSASDTISLALCKAILPDHIFQMIMYCRSPFTFHRGRFVRLHMVSSMGNGFTFPLETYIFSLVTFCVARRRGIRLARFDRVADFGVFGDDIVCPSVIFDDVCHALRSLGFFPNTLKSFANGYFRESCGHDYYYGINVRGVYVKRLDNDAHFYSAINRIMRFCAKHKICVPLSTICDIRQVHHFVPYFEADTAGIKVPSCQIKRKRQTFRYSRLAPKQRKFKVLIDGVLRRTHDNFHGFLLAACRVGDTSVLVRRVEAHVHYATERCWSPHWDDPLLYGSERVFWETLTLS